jgi:hypothetical protein
MARLLKDVSREDFAAMKDGQYQFYFETPRGKTGTVTLDLSGSARKKFRDAAFDMSSSNWNLKSEVVDTFGTHCSDEIRKIFPGLNLTPHRIKIPEGGPRGCSCLSLSIPKEYEGEWLLKSASIILDVGNLTWCWPEVPPERFDKINQQPRLV